MDKKMFQRQPLLLLISILLLCTACQATDPSPAVSPSPPSAPQPTLAPTPLPTPVVTAAPTASPTPETGESAETNPQAPPVIIVGSKDHTGQILLGKMQVVLLKEAGYDVVDKTGLGDSAAVRAALESGAIDLYVESTGAALTAYHGIPAPAQPSDPDRSHSLAKSLDDPLDIVWLDRGYFDDAYTLVAPQHIRDRGIATLEELADYMNANGSLLTLCVENEFYNRRLDGLSGLQEHYFFSFLPENILVVEADQGYEELLVGRCDIAAGRIADGRIAAWGFHPLADTLNFFPAYVPAPVIRRATLIKYPELSEVLGEIGAHLDNTSLSQLSARVSLGADGAPNSGDEESASDVAHDFLQTHLLLGERPQITVGSQQRTGQLILGQALVLILEEAGYQVVDKTGLGDLADVRAALESGEIDLCLDTTGDALSGRHGLPPSALPADPDRSHALAQRMDQPLNLVWLERGDLNNTYTLVASQSVVEQGVATLEELASFMNSEEPALTLCAETEFLGRPQDGLSGLQAHYHFSFPEENILPMEPGQTYQGLLDGRCDVAQGRAAGWGFHTLEDTLDFFPLYTAAPVVRQESLNEHPELAELLNQFSALLGNAAMAQLNVRVNLGSDGTPGSGDEETVEDAALDFLQRAGLLGGRPRIMVGAEEGQAALLGKMWLLMLQQVGYQAADRTELGDSRAALESGEIDLYAASTGRALSLAHGLGPAELPADPDQSLTLIRRLDEPLGITWLERTNLLGAPLDVGGDLVTTTIIAPAIRQVTLEKYPELDDLLAQLSFRLDNATMSQLHARVELGADGETVESVAALFLCQIGLLRDCSAAVAGPEQVCRELVSNGNFERKGGWYLPTTDQAARYTTGQVHQGEQAMLLGGLASQDDRFGHSVAHQRVVIPQGARSAALSYWYYPLSRDSADVRGPQSNDGDSQSVLVYDAEMVSVRQRLMMNLSDEQTWVLQTHDLGDLIGEEIQIFFYVVNDGDGRASAMYVDDVSLQVCYGSN